MSAPNSLTAWLRACPVWAVLIGCSGVDVDERFYVCRSEDDCGTGLTCEVPPGYPFGACIKPGAPLPPGFPPKDDKDTITPADAEVAATDNDDGTPGPGAETTEKDASDGGDVGDSVDTSDSADATDDADGNDADSTDGPADVIEDSHGGDSDTVDGVDGVESDDGDILDGADLSEVDTSDSGDAVDSEVVDTDAHACEVDCQVGVETRCEDGQVRTCIAGEGDCPMWSELADCVPTAACLAATCVEAGCEEAPKDDACYIDSVCYVFGDAKPDGDGCLICDPLVLQDDWSIASNATLCASTECLEGGLCLDGTCSDETAVDCDDKNVCTDDSCDDLTGCLNEANSAVCSDDSACTLSDHCEATLCVGKVKDCDDKEQCTSDHCDAILGCQNDPLTNECNDGVSCTKNDVCTSGLCLGTPDVSLCGTPASDCVVMSCDPVTGCESTNDNSLCDDGNECTNDLCGAGGCVNQAASGGCDDGDPCTSTDTCSNKVCAGTAKVCPGTCGTCRYCPKDEAQSGGTCLIAKKLTTGVSFADAVAQMETLCPQPQNADDHPELMPLKTAADNAAAEQARAFTCGTASAWIGIAAVGGEWLIRAAEPVEFTNWSGGTEPAAPDGSGVSLNAGGIWTAGLSTEVRTCIVCRHGGAQDGMCVNPPAPCP